MSERALRYARALGWAAFAAAPVLLATLAVASSRPSAPTALVGRSAWVAWIAAALAFAASILRSRDAVRPSRAVAGLAGLTVAAWCGLLVWIAAALPR